MSLLEKRVSLKWVLVGLLLAIAVFAVVNWNHQVNLKFKGIEKNFEDANKAIRQLDVNGQTLAQVIVYNIQQGRLYPMPQQQPAAKEEPKPAPKEPEKKK